MKMSIENCLGYKNEQIGWFTLGRKNIFKCISSIVTYYYSQYEILAFQSLTIEFILNNGFVFILFTPLHNSKIAQYAVIVASTEAREFKPNKRNITIQWFLEMEKKKRFFFFFEKFNTDGRDFYWHQFVDTPHVDFIQFNFDLLSLIDGQVCHQRIEDQFFISRKWLK